MKKTFFSVIIPTFNRAGLLEKALRSIMNQTFSDWECIIVDDGSTDNTGAFMQDWIRKDARFRYIYQENTERSAARNNGIKNSNGMYICFLDSDDYYLPNRLNNFYEYLVENKYPVALIFSGILFENNGSFSEREVQITPTIKEKIFDYLTLTIIGTPQICVSSEVLSEFQFDIRFRFSEDLELCFRVAHKYPILPQPYNLTVVALDHDNRTVGYKYFNTSKEQMKTWRYIFDKDHSGKFISRKTKNRQYGYLLFNEAKYYMFNNKKFKATYFIIKSLLFDPFNKFNKHRLYCLFSIFAFKIPIEYSK
ncbi:MAG: glycosyltransferase family 2 protein [Bacteroidota bacterium]